MSLVHVLRLDFAAAPEDEWNAAEQRLRQLLEVSGVRAVAVARDRFQPRVVAAFVHVDGETLDEYLSDPTHVNVADWLRSCGVTSTKLDVSAATLTDLA